MVFQLAMVLENHMEDRRPQWREKLKPQPIVRSKGVTDTARALRRYELAAVPVTALTWYARCRIIRSLSRSDQRLVLGKLVPASLQFQIQADFNVVWIDASDRVHGAKALAFGET